MIKNRFSTKAAGAQKTQGP